MVAWLFWPKDLHTSPNSSHPMDTSVPCDLMQPLMPTALADGETDTAPTQRHLKGHPKVLSTSVLLPSKCITSVVFLSEFIHLFLERVEGREKGREGKKHRSVAFCVPPTWDLACNSGMCPDRESNLWPFVSQTGTQPTEPHQPGQTQNLQYIKRQKTEQAQNQTQIGQRCRDYQTGRFKQLG